MRVNNSSIAGALDGISAIFLAGYLAAVVYQGNTGPLVSSVVKDAPGFLEILVSIYLLTLIVNIRGPVGDIAGALVALALVALVLKAATDNTGALRAYSSGQLSLFGLVQRLATGK